jgi:hypothetical protein
VTQERNFRVFVGADGVPADAGELAFFSEPEALASDTVTAGTVTSDMLKRGNGRMSAILLADRWSRVLSLSSLLTPASRREEAGTRLFSLPTRAT